MRSGRHFETEIQLAEGDPAVTCLLDLHHAIVSADEDVSGAVLEENVREVPFPSADGIAGEELCWTRRRMGYSISVDLGTREAADARLGGDPVITFTRLQDIEDRGAPESVTHGIFDKPLTIEAVEPLQRAEPEKSPRVEDDAPDVIVREPVGGRVDPHRQLLRVDGRRCRQRHPNDQRCCKSGD